MSPITRGDRIEHRKQQIVKHLRKRDKKSLRDLAVAIGATTNGLTNAVADLVADGVAICHKGRPNTYTKA